jgi:hypothetical protein
MDKSIVTGLLEVWNCPVDGSNYIVASFLVSISISVGGSSIKNSLFFFRYLLVDDTAAAINQIMQRYRVQLNLYRYQRRGCDLFLFFFVNEASVIFVRARIIVNSINDSY